MDDQQYCDSIAPCSRRRVLVHSLAASLLTMALGAWRLRSGVAMIGDSGSYLAGASGLSHGRWFETPLVPSFSELSVLQTVRHGGWSPFADFGIGLPLLIALFDIVLPLRTAAICVNVMAIGLITAAVVVGPWRPARRSELWMRTVLALALGCWPILRFTAAGVLSEPVFCAGLIWLGITVARTNSARTSRLIGLGALTLFLGMTRFVGPVLAIVVAMLLVQRGTTWRRATGWAVITASAPVLAAVAATRGAGSRVVSFHALDTTDVFFLSRGFGGWFEAGMGDQTSTLIRSAYQPSLFDWCIASTACILAVFVMWRWLTSIRQQHPSALEPCRVIAVTLVLAVIPSMVMLDAVLKLENRILMPSGILAISAAGWWLANRPHTTLAWATLSIWTIVATHPWQWLDRLPPPEPTALTRAIQDIDPVQVVTNRADLVWWITGVPARYIPDGFRPLSARTEDPVLVMVDLPCALADAEGIIVIESAGVVPAVSDRLALDTRLGRYVLDERPQGVDIYTPTGIDC